MGRVDPSGESNPPTAGTRKIDPADAAEISLAAAAAAASPLFEGRARIPACRDYIGGEQKKDHSGKMRPKGFFSRSLKVLIRGTLAAPMKLYARSQSLQKSHDGIVVETAVILNCNLRGVLKQLPTVEKAAFFLFTAKYCY